ncbi:unnamed protein product [Polarella glacialis]|uniref:Uncharacterized protein n=1 Tax=Polarella glacialis TaxID=89957 RepID=A0A813IX13_POLGL|nr:unnamed protein product [Polarella glacialis]
MMLQLIDSPTHACDYQQQQQIPYERRRTLQLRKRTFLAIMTPARSRQIQKLLKTTNSKSALPRVDVMKKSSRKRAQSLFTSTGGDPEAPWILRSQEEQQAAAHCQEEAEVTEALRPTRQKRRRQNRQKSGSCPSKKLPLERQPVQEPVKPCEEEVRQIGDKKKKKSKKRQKQITTTTTTTTAAAATATITTSQRANGEAKCRSREQREPEQQGEKVGNEEGDELPPALLDWLHSSLEYQTGNIRRGYANNKEERRLQKKQKLEEKQETRPEKQEERMEVEQASRKSRRQDKKRKWRQGRAKKQAQKKLGEKHEQQQLSAQVDRQDTRQAEHQEEQADHEAKQKKEATPTATATTITATATTRTKSTMTATTSTTTTKQQQQHQQQQQERPQDRQEKQTDHEPKQKKEDQEEEKKEERRVDRWMGRIADVGIYNQKKEGYDEEHKGSKDLQFSSGVRSACASSSNFPHVDKDNGVGVFLAALQPEQRIADTTTAPNTTATTITTSATMVNFNNSFNASSSSQLQQQFRCFVDKSRAANPFGTQQQSQEPVGESAAPDGEPETPESERSDKCADAPRLNIGDLANAMLHLPYLWGRLQAGDISQEEFDDARKYLEYDVAEHLELALNAKHPRRKQVLKRIFASDVPVESLWA